MPKVKRKELIDVYNDMLRKEEFKNEFVITENSIENQTLRCVKCVKDLKCVKKYHLEQHFIRPTHLASIKRSKQSINNRTISQTQFNKILANFCAKLMIPFNKVSDEVFVSFIETFTQYKCPSRHSLAKSYLPLLSDEIIEKIRNELDDDYLWVSTDETTDVKGRHVANVMIGPMNPQKPNKSYLIDRQVVPKCDNINIYLTVITAFSLLWPNQTKPNKILLFLSDAASYMHVAANNLKKDFPKLIHLTCLCHGLNLVYKFLKNKHSGSFGLVKLGRQIFTNCNTRRQKFQELYKDTPLPPSYSLTRWCSLIKSLLWYNKYYDEFKSFALTLDNSCDRVRELQEHLTRFPLLKPNIKYVIENYKFISDAIYALEREDMCLKDSISLFESVGLTLSTINDDVFEEFERVVHNNPGYDKIKEIYEILFGNSEQLSTNDLTLEQIECIIRAPLTNAAVERSFSKYKKILSDSRHLLSNDSLKQLITVNYNKNIVCENNSFHL